LIPKECKRLAEVDFPIAVVSRHSARDKSTPEGYPSTLHLWWARRPLAACRAILLALLLPDPCDADCPSDFKEHARQLLRRIYAQEPKLTDKDLQQALLRFIGDFANWDNATEARYLDVGRGLVKAAHGEDAPLVVDPFAGGGSIPLEALRLGCEAFARDLNPVACLILKVMLEDIPRHGSKLARELERARVEMKEKAEKELRRYYPPEGDGVVPVAYIWARTVKCESPACGAEIPLIRSFFLCDKSKRMRALRYRVKRPKGQSPRVEFELFTPKSEDEVPAGTVTLAKARCLACERVLNTDRIRAQLQQERGGADVVFDEHGQRVGGSLLIAVVTKRQGEVARSYRLPSIDDYSAVRRSISDLAELVPDPELGISPIPSEPIPHERVWKNNPIRVHHYGMAEWGDLFTARQKLSLYKFFSLVKVQLNRDDSLGRPLALALGKLVRHCNVLSKWHRGSETVAGAFGMQALSMSWDFPEAYPFSEYAGGFDDALSDAISPLASLGKAINSIGQVSIGDAADLPLPDDSASVCFTDPPYYDAIPYSDLSDFFFVWIKRALPQEPLLSDKFDQNNPLTPKALEIVQNDARTFRDRPKDKLFFEERMAASFAEARRVIADSGVLSVVFAHKTTEGWEALISAIVNSGFYVTASWPIATERGARLRARESAALATSVHLVCRPRAENAETGDWSEVFQELPNRIGAWMERLGAEGVRGADLVFACIGPAMEVYSRYSRVEDAEGREIPLGGDPEAVEPYKRGSSPTCGKRLAALRWSKSWALRKLALATVPLARSKKMLASLRCSSGPSRALRQMAPPVQSPTTKARARTKMKKLAWANQRRGSP
jgi:putative DNA methylase